MLGDVIDPIAFKFIVWVIVLALAFRFGILFLNEYWNYPPYWGVMARKALAVVWSDFGAHPLPEDFQELYNATLANAVSSWQLNDRGLTLLYAAMNKIFGQVTYLHIKVFHLVLDALIVAPVMLLANRISGSRGAVFAGIIYALFLPQAQMAVSPDYNSWLGGTMVLMTWLSVRIIEERQRTMFIVLLCMLIIVNYIGNEFRSIVALFAFGAAGWLWLVEVSVRRTLFLPKACWKPIIAFVIVGAAVMSISASVNYFARGEYSPVRSSFGHAFFTGVGQYKNPIGMSDSDKAPADWYAIETGKTDTNSTLDQAYNAWLSDQAKAFIVEYPALYSSMVVRRAVSILFPNMAFTLVTDLPSYTLLPRQKELVKVRKSIVAAHGWASMITLMELIKEDLSYVVGLGFRVLLLMILPIGIFSAIWLSKSRAVSVFALLPLAYGMITLSFVYVTPPVVTGIHAAVLSVSASGLYLLFCHIKEGFNDTHINPRNSIIDTL